MIRSKCVSGFTLLEILVALTICAMIITPLFVLQGVIMKGAGKWTARVQRTIRAHNFLVNTQKEALEKGDEEFYKEESITSPKTTLRFSQKKAAIKTSTYEFPSLYTQKVTIEWDEGDQIRRDNLIFLIYKEEKK